MVDEQQLHHPVLGLVGGLEVCWVRTTMSGVHVWCTTQRLALAFDLDQTLPARADGIEQWWSQNLGICTPISSAARITKVPWAH